MPLVPFEKEQVEGIAGLDVNPDAPEGEGKNPSFFSETLPAAWRYDNQFGAAFSNVLKGKEAQSTEEDGTVFNPWPDIEGTKYEQYSDRFADTRNKAYHESMKSQIDREEEDRNTLQASGFWKGGAASMLVSLADPSMLIPGGSLYKTGKGAYSIARSAVAVAGASALAAGAQEAGLQAQQVTRSGAESAMNIGTAALLGGVFGGGVATLANRKALNDIAKRIDSAPEPEVINTPELKGGIEDPTFNGWVDVREGSVEGNAAGAAASEKPKFDEYGMAGKPAQKVQGATSAVKLSS